MKTHDPILIRIGIWFDRAVLFVVGAILTALLVWLYVLLGPLNVAWRNLLLWAQAAWSPDGHMLPRVITGGCLLIGLLTTLLVYMATGRWWSKKGTVQHHRGARFDEMEG